MRADNPTPLFVSGGKIRDLYSELGARGERYAIINLQRLRQDRCDNAKESQKVKIDGQEPAAGIAITTEDIAPEEAVAAVADAIAAAEQADIAKYALAKQIEQLRQSDALQRQQRSGDGRAAHLAPTREQRLEAWKEQGLTEAGGRMDARASRLIHRPDVTQHAVAAAMRAGLERGTDDFHRAVENNFNAMMAKIEAAAAAPIPPLSQRPPPLSHHHHRRSRHRHLKTTERPSSASQ